jgi:carboxyl-terminal processing protease
MFVKKGETIVTTKGRVAEENRVYTTLESPLDLEIPLTVLIDEGSASASEIVAGSIQDLDRGVVIGETSYGKGLVQRTYDLKYGSKVKLTIAKYYTPSGRCVQRLEYYDKESNAKAKEIPDSLLKTFQTKNGRNVIDGRGIEPDVKIENPDYSRLTAVLMTSNCIFNYATDYVLSHPTIARAEEFTLSESDYADFQKYALAQDFKYTTASEESLKKMKETAEKEGYFEEIKADYEDMISKVTPSKERDLVKFKAEISELLENEIISRYYFQKGRTVASLKNDIMVQKAIEVLTNSTQLNTILKK